MQSLVFDEACNLRSETVRQPLFTLNIKHVLISFSPFYYVNIESTVSCTRNKHQLFYYKLLSVNSYTDFVTCS